jgi:ABC-type uncharacterized transport system YnjBCD permease subunit
MCVLLCMQQYVETSTHTHVYTSLLCTVCTHEWHTQVAKMLDQNLVGSFQKTPEFAVAKAQCTLLQNGPDIEAAIVAEEFDR